MRPRPRGFALITVMLALLIAASVALLLNIDVGMEQRLLTTDQERTELAYVAEAGLAHARWRLAQNTSCTGYTALPATPFGGHNYNASFDPDAGSPTTINLTAKHAAGVVQTTTHIGQRAYEPAITLPLQLGTDPGKDVMIDGFYDMSNYGGIHYLDVRSDPGWTERVLLEFDVSAVPGGVKIISAVLELKQNSVGTPGAIGVHRVTRGWQEGTGLGTGNSDGASWLEYDGTIPWAEPGGEFASTPYGSTSITSATNGQWAAWEIRDLVQTWVSGEFPNYGLMLVGDGVVNAASFDSREASDPANAPKLTITYACECGMGESGTLELTPAGVGEDSYIDDGVPTTNWGGSAEIRISEKTNSKKRGLMRFDVSALPPVATVDSAVLELNLEGIGSGGTATIFLHEATTAWAEHQANWNDAQSGTPWGTPGADYDATPVTSAGIDATLPGPTPFNIPSLVQGWVDDPNSNLGVVLVGSDGVNHADFTTSDSATAALHPKLTISYSCPCGSGCGGAGNPPNGAKVLMVVPDPGALSTQQDAKKTLIESWGYAVNLIDDSAPAGDFDTAFASNDVVYVAAGVADAEIGTKLVDAAIGVVNEEGKQIDELGVASDKINKTRDEIDIVDNTHYITQPFVSGLLTITSSLQSIQLLTSGLAPDLRELGQGFNVGSNWAPALAALETGAALAGGGTAAGRRVQLPWGVETFDINAMNDNGRAIVKRALEWGAGAGAAPPTGPIAHWKLDDGSGLTALDSEGGHHGTLTNGPTWTTGTIGDALDFDGADDFVDLTSDAPLDDVFVGGATAMAWIKPQSWGENGYGRIFDKSSSPSATGDGWVIRMNADNEIINFGQGFTTSRGWWRLDSGTITLGAWQHIAVVYDAAATENDPLIYVDGKAENVTRVDAPAGTPRSDAAINLRLGNYAGGTTHSFQGVIDDARIYDRMLNATEIGDVFSGGSGGGGGGHCAATFADDFETDTYAGSTGTHPWATDWTEINDDGNPDLQDEQVTRPTASGNHVLQVRDNDGGGEGVWRELNLDGYASATLTLIYWPDGLDNANDAVSIAYSPNGGTDWTQVALIEGPGSYDETTPTVLANLDLTGAIGPNARIRFLTSSGMGQMDAVYFDDVTICAN